MPNPICSFCGVDARTLHRMNLPRGTYRACPACLALLEAELLDITGKAVTNG